MFDAAYIITEVTKALRVDDARDDDIIIPIIDEAIAYLQRFKRRELMPQPQDVVDPKSQEALGPLEFRVIVLYVQKHYDGDDLDDALRAAVELVRDR